MTIIAITGRIITAFVCLTIVMFYAAQNSHATRTVYSIQAGSYKTLSAAEKDFNAIVRQSAATVPASLRVEKIGNFYTVRLGEFTDYNSAEQYLAPVKSGFPKAMVMRAYLKEERIIKQYKGSTSAKDSKARRATSPIRITKKVAPPIKKSTVIAKTAPQPKAAKVSRATFHAIDDFPQTVDLGKYKPDYFRKVAIALYNRDLVDEAIYEMNRAVKLSPDNALFRIELAALYLADNRIISAKKQYYSALKINPSMSRAYYYLAELFIEEGKMDMAWLSLRISQHLGFDGEELLGRLRSLSDEPAMPALKIEKDALHMRQILVFSNDKARKIVRRFKEGELFEDLAAETSYGANATDGGYVGHMTSSDIHPGIAEALLEQKVFGRPSIVKTESGFHVVQRIAPFSLDVVEKNLAGRQEARMDLNTDYGKTLSSLR